MGVSGISPGSLLLVLLIVLLLFGTKKLRNMGEDLGKAYQGFKKGVRDVQTSEEHKEKENV